MIEVFTDGGCRHNPGPGAWAFVVVCDGVVVYKGSSFSRNTTNNEMELTAILSALRYLKSVGATAASIYSDSQYAINAITVWYGSWCMSGALAKKKNVDIISSCVSLMSPGFRLFWVKGHSSNHFNNQADRLVNETIDRFLMP